MIKLIVIDDDEIICKSLKIIISQDPAIDVVALGHSGEEAIKLYEKYKPDIVLMDIRMGNLSGLEAGEEILKRYKDAKILYLTTFLDDEYIIKALNIGAKGYLLKQDYDSILPSIKAVYANQNVFGNEIISKLPNLVKQNERDAYLKAGITDREYEIIVNIAEGLSNKELSKKLHLSEGTIRNYISLILEKLELRDRTQIAIDYYKRKIG